MGFADVRQRQHRMDRHFEPALLEQLRNDTLIIACRGAHAVHIEFPADQVDDPQWNLLHFAADRTEGAAEPHHIDT